MYPKIQIKRETFSFSDSPMYPKNPFPIPPCTPKNHVDSPMYPKISFSIPPCTPKKPRKLDRGFPHVPQKNYVDSPMYPKKTAVEFSDSLSEACWLDARPIRSASARAGLGHGSATARLRLGWLRYWRGGGAYAGQRRAETLHSGGEHRRPCT